MVRRKFLCLATRPATATWSAEKGQDGGVPKSWVAVSSGECFLEIGDIGGRGRTGPAGLQSAAQASKIVSDLDQTGRLAEAEDGMRPALLMASPSEMASGQPEFPACRLAFNRALGTRAGEGRTIIHCVGLPLGSGSRPVNLFDGALHAFPPAAALQPLTGFTIHHSGIEEGRGQPGEAPMAANGTREGRKSLGQIAGLGGNVRANGGGAGGRVRAKRERRRGERCNGRLCGRGTWRYERSEVSGRPSWHDLA